ncbi:DUF3570 domain-containing protein [Limnohabitans sp. Rim8]|uniref:DUF3570 domain-containing protein n=1 Tax=Limnohabitans sp. Rim8 TaxID=1100718 RepID=UPI0025DCCB43|nr:DUF3570 domain-containing protein [Limnohabitans sp. Rim8]
MAATEPSLQTALLAAAMALPGLCLVTPIAHAETAPERGYVSFKVLDYLDSQPGAERIRVRAPALSALVPLGDQWSVSGTLITDSISGASPAYHDAAITPLRDFRRAVDASVTHYLPQGTWSLGVSHSKEADYLSRSVYGTGTRSNDSKNTIWNWGLAVSNDDITPLKPIQKLPSGAQTKQTVDLIAGVTQVLSPNDLVQINLGWSQNQGYLSDPYKRLDQRPDSRTRQTLQVRWNHHLEGSGATMRSAYRYFQDSWQIRAHTLDMEHIQPLGEQWKVSSIVRYYSQSAARFYVESDGKISPFGPRITPGLDHQSLDSRLSAFGAITLGFKLTHQLSRDTQIDLKLEHYEQRGRWAMGAGSANLLPFRARSLSWGLTHWF